MMTSKLLWSSELVWSARTPTSHLSPSFRNLALRSIHHSTAVLEPANQSVTGSEKLFADAIQEEADEHDGGSASTEGSRTKLIQLESQNRDWTGEESMQDAVLRMLVDKYKPHRSGPIRTADQKLKESPPQVRKTNNVPSVQTHQWREIAGTPLLPSIEGHRPWHTTFKAPSHATASIKLGNLTSSHARSSIGSDDSYGSTARTDKEVAKRKRQASRLSHARESTLDYRLGLRGGDAGNGYPPSQINPVSLKGWQGLIEDRIEKAKLAGQFDKLKGRGQPITRVNEERNPFIAREEFLMNRIVQRNGAAPPWVEVQIELEAAVNAFRETLKQSWTRRAIRTFGAGRSAPSLLSLASLRDREWEERECSYHDAAIAELNSLVRKHNAMAPYAVRRLYYARDAELARVYQDCAEDIFRGMHEKGQTGLYPDERRCSVDERPGAGPFLGIWKLILQWLRRHDG